jgi:hypothetical protein
MSATPVSRCRVQVTFGTDQARRRINALSAQLGIASPQITSLQTQLTLYKSWGAIKRTRPIYYWHVVSGYAQVRPDGFLREPRAVLVWGVCARAGILRSMEGVTILSLAVTAGEPVVPQQRRRRGTRRCARRVFSSLHPRERLAVALMCSMEASALSAGLTATASRQTSPAAG